MIKKGPDDVIPSATEDDAAEQAKETPPPTPKLAGERGIQDAPTPQPAPKEPAD